MSSTSRRSLNIALNLILPGLLIVSFASGWIASSLGWTEFGLHKYSSVAAFAAAAAHLALHWRSLSSQFRRLWSRPHAAAEHARVQLVDPSGDRRAA